MGNTQSLSASMGPPTLGGFLPVSPSTDRLMMQARQQVQSHTLGGRLKRQRRSSLVLWDMSESDWLESCPAREDEEEGGHSSFSAFTLKGALGVMAIGTAVSYCTRLVLRDIIGHRFDSIAQRSVLEVYLLSSLHSLAWLGLGYHNIPDFLSRFLEHTSDKQGAEELSGVMRMLCLSAGHYVHETLSLRHAWSSDPLMLLNNASSILSILTYLRCTNITWFALRERVLHELPTVFMNCFLLVEHFRPKTSSDVKSIAQMTALCTLAVTKLLLAPLLCYVHFVKDPKPDTHQDAFRLSKFALLLNLSVHAVYLFRIFRLALNPRHTSRHVTFVRDLMFLLRIARNAGKSLFLSVYALGFITILMGSYATVPAAMSVITHIVHYKPGLWRWALAVTAGLFVTAVTPVPTRAVNITHMPSLFRWPVSLLNSAFEQYFEFRTIEETPLSPERSYMIAAFPHGLQPFAMMCYGLQCLLKGEPLNIAAASVLFKIPVLRQILGMTGSLPATQANIQAQLSRPYPYNKTIIMPGGIGEMFLCRSDIEIILISSHKGFVKAALRAGADIVPAYMFGNTQLYRVMGGEVGRILQNISRKLQVSLIGFYGRFGTPLPFPTPLTFVTGKPIRVAESVAHPSQDLIDSVHTEFKREVRALFYRHAKHHPGFKNKLLLFDDEDIPPAPKPSIAEFTRFPHKL